VEVRLHRYGNARSRTRSFVPTVNPHDRESAMQTITKRSGSPTTLNMVSTRPSLGPISSAHVASQIGAGRAVINNMTDDPQAPSGGFKYSGIGREYGRYGIEAFLEPRAILE